MFKSASTGNFSLFLLFFLNGFALQLRCQTEVSKNSIAVSWFSFLSAKQDFTYNASLPPNVNLSSARIISFAGKIDYFKKINDRFDVSIGAFSGAYPMDFIISFDSSFSNIGYNYDDYDYDRYSSNYLGLSIGAKYIQRLSEKHSLSASLKLNYIFIIPQWYVYRLAALIDTGIHNIFKANARMNPEGKAFFAPEFSIGYHFKINNYFEPYLSMNGVYAKNYPIIGNSYTLYGDDKNVEGTFRRRFLQAGIEVGVKVNLPERKKTT